MNGVILSDLSDHLFIFSITDFKLMPHKDATDNNNTTRVITNSSLEAFDSELQSYDWRSVLSLYNPTEALDAFWNGVCNLYDKYLAINIHRINELIGKKQTNKNLPSSFLKKQ